MKTHKKPQNTTIQKKTNQWNKGKNKVKYRLTKIKVHGSNN